MRTSPGRVQLSQKWDPYGRVHSASYETHDTVYSETKLDSKGELRCHGGNGSNRLNIKVCYTNFTPYCKEENKITVNI